MMETFASNEYYIATVLGWTILHSFWQILLVFLGLKLLLSRISKQAAAIRYKLSIAALAFAFLWSVHTFLSEWNQYHFEVTQGNNVISEELLIPFTSIQANEINAFDFFSAWVPSVESLLPYLTIFWFIGMFFFSSKMLVGLFQLNSFSKQGIHPIPDKWLDRLEELKQLHGIRRKIDIRLSDLVPSPITYRFFRPIILLPFSVFTGLSDDQIEVLLMHELAHIRRHDYLVNILQSVVEMLFFYHPLIWWISKNVRVEREHCCDDEVMQLRYQPMLYAQTLTQIQSQHYSLKTQLAMSANGNKGVFTQRIYRLFQQPESPSNLRNSVIALLLIGLSGTMMAFYPGASQEIQKDIQTIEVVQDTVPDSKTKKQTIEIVKETISEGVEYKEVIEIEEVQELPETKEVPVVEEISEIKEIPATQEVPEIEEVPVLEEKEIIEVPSFEKTKKTIRVETDKGEKVRMKIKEESPLLSIKLVEKVQPKVFLDKQPFNDWKIDKDNLLKVNFPTNKIKTVNVYKGSKSKEYTGVSHNGDVIEIVSLDYVADPFIEFPKAKNEVIRVEEVPNDKQPLIIIDGEKSTSTNIEDELSPEDIATINVIKGESALQKYGDEGVNGVIEIITKGNKSKTDKIQKKKIKKADKKLKEPKSEKVVIGQKHPSKEKTKEKNISIFPNPAGDKTKIKVKVKKKSKVSVSLYDSKGQLVKTLVNNTLDAGDHQFEWNSRNHPAGTYFVKYLIGTDSGTQKLLVQKEAR